VVILVIYRILRHLTIMWHVRQSCDLGTHVWLYTYLKLQLVEIGLDRLTVAQLLGMILA
jgi:hypothetical protein